MGRAEASTSPPRHRSSLNPWICTGTSGSIATGFLFTDGDGVYLITNRHVVTSLHQESNEMLSAGFVPWALRLRLRAPDVIDTGPILDIDLYSEPGAPRWLEHPALGSAVDVVAIPKELPESCCPILYGPAPWPPQVLLPVTARLSVVGFPFGQSVGRGLALWTTGTIASEVDIDADGLPMFLIDARTREGQSGFHVAFYNARQAVHYRNGSLIDNFSDHLEPGGVYSGRINDAIDLGRVWKAPVIEAIIHGGRPGSTIREHA